MATQADFTLTACRDRTTAPGAVTRALWKRRRANHTTAFSILATILYLASHVSRAIEEHKLILHRYNRISASHFSFNFNGYSDQECFLKFRFTKRDLIRMVRAVAWPQNQTHTARNRYLVTPILATCIVLRRVSSPSRWEDLEVMFGKRRPHLSEIYWEALEHMWNAHGTLMSTMSSIFLQERASSYAEAVHAKSGALSNCIGFIDGTILGIARPKGHRRQRVVYNGHKRKHALKCQATNTPDGLILHASGPIEGRRHDCTLYIRSGMEEALSLGLSIGGRRYCIYGDSGYNRRLFLDVPFQGSDLNAA